MLHLPHLIRLVLHLGPVIINIHLLRHQLLLVLHTPLPVQCTRLQMLLTLHLLYNIHQMLEVHNTISRIVPVRQFIHLLIFRWQVQGKSNSVLTQISLLSLNILFQVFSYFPDLFTWCWKSTLFAIIAQLFTNISKL